MDVGIPESPSRWALGAAYAVPLCVLPSAIWRLYAATEEGSDTSWYLVFLSVLSMALALLTLGLVHDWGQRVPHWVPRFGGTPIPARPVVFAAVIGGSLLVALCVYVIVNQTFHLVGRAWVGIGHEEPTREAPGWDVMRYYLPLVAWGPLVIAVAADYRRRVVLRC
ncbi:hypothetical protein [Actinoplanes derwentensis]|uniref:Uncharacterized protein n=1 Tax=Actinoplanes derwentensis TaxID=113562 RepID=A0A1H1S6R5_9ACTN|nr:hypothetical protein [Actinoplanes derwentensis]GID89685.1 hypothetical protein Ade03nite_86090 [Actinoplanes derwentensis]SDS43652.1 hypothetical protein SAMN04489716_0780 [Actinoplanes derwentensis]